MTAMATEPATPTNEQVQVEAAESIDELRRYTPEEVAANKWLPWTPRMIREKCKRHELRHHRDGGRITLTADDIRAYNEASATHPLSKTRRVRKAA
ncbi:hypothetical protein OG552_10155 [Streptomyces sp. NBC_01476]|uniref:hypothetical protein n=1 Tax=Streptomyces sp. NBC_01476 TaxID=2903881 RepID=UPI002E32617D|nr:hypothetical protein [Streptomyces sp. NBC_01476]